MWNLQTRLGPGSGKIVNPVKIGEGSVSVDLVRRIGVSPVVDGKAILVILGSRENDVLTYAEVGDSVFKVNNEVDLPGRGGTIPDAAIDIWQDPVGRIFQGRRPLKLLDYPLTRAISRYLGICESGR